MASALSCACQPALIWTPLPVPWSRWATGPSALTEMPAVDAMRALVLGQSAGAVAWLSLAWSLAIVAVFAPVAIYAYRQATARQTEPRLLFPI